jgi:hypothetical protein
MKKSFRALGLLLLGVALGAGACSKDDKKPKENDKVTAVDDKAKSGKRAPKKPKVDKELEALAKVVKTEEDFEATAEKEILAENLEGEVEKLEQEIAPTAK